MIDKIEKGLEDFKKKNTRTQSEVKKSLLQNDKNNLDTINIKRRGRIKILSTFTNAEILVPKINNIEIREFIEGNYLLNYIRKKEEIIVLRIHHSARKISKKTKLK